MHSTVTDTGEPVVEEWNSASNNSANRSSPYVSTDGHAAGTMVDKEKARARRSAWPFERFNSRAESCRD
jgi:hypothetical protein